MRLLQRLALWTEMRDYLVAKEQMGNCVSSNALKVTIEDGKTKRTVFISMKKMKTFRTMEDFLRHLRFTTEEFKQMYKTDTRPIEVLEPFSPFRIQNFVIGTKKVKVTRLF
jgi:hypothetical protein